MQQFSRESNDSRRLHRQWTCDRLTHHVVTDDEIYTVVARSWTFQRVVDLMSEHWQVLRKPAHYNTVWRKLQPFWYICRKPYSFRSFSKCQSLWFPTSCLRQPSYHRMTAIHLRILLRAHVDYMVHGQQLAILTESWSGKGPSVHICMICQMINYYRQQHMVICWCLKRER